jgi:Interferon-related protein conserved region
LRFLEVIMSSAFAIQFFFKSAQINFCQLELCRMISDGFMGYSQVVTRPLLTTVCICVFQENELMRQIFSLGPPILASSVRTKASKNERVSDKVILIATAICESFVISSSLLCLSRL